MEQLKKLLASISPRQRIAILLVTLLAGTGIWGLLRWRKEQGFKPLYLSLAQEDAAAVVQKLKEGAVEYRLSDDGNVISVPAAKVAEVRLNMAAAGLPKTGRIGFEIFDKNNFGATEFVEHVNYRRALEGELERSVMCLAEVEQARVHLTFPKDSVFLESQQPAKGSVMVRLRPGAKLSPQNVLAVTHMVSSAVEGLAPEAVSVLDMRGTLLSRPRKNPTDENDYSEGMLEFRQKVEKDLLLKINATLEPLLGPEKYRAGISVDCDISSAEQSEETYDPAKSVMANSQKTEEVSTGGAPAGIPGTASNLPRPAARPASATAGMSRKTENITYQSSRLVRKTRLPQGGIKRLSVSVLLDQELRWDMQGAQPRRVLVPASPEKIKSVQQLVAGVTGFVQARGDQIIVETLPFESTLNQEPPPMPAKPAPAPTKGGPKPWDALLKVPKMVLMIAGGALLLVLSALAFLVFRWRKAARRKPEEAGLPKELAGGGRGAPKISAPVDPAKELEDAIAERAVLQAKADADVLRSIKAPAVTTKKTDVIVKELKESIKSDAAVPTHVLRDWINEKES